MNVFCVDLGTSSLKAALISDTGDCLFFTRIKYKGESLLKKMLSPVFSFKPGFSQTHWEMAFTRAMENLEKSTAPDQSLDGIIISGNGPSLVCMRKNRVNEIILWNTKIPIKLIKQSGASLFLPYILYFKTKKPAKFKKTDCILGIPEYMVYILTGKKATILPESRYLKTYWTKESLESLNIKAEILPGFVSPGTCAGTFRTNFKDKNMEIPVYYGAPDFISALVGTGATTPGKIFDRAGSSEGLNLVISQPPESQGKLRLLPSIIPGLWNLSYLIPDSGEKFSRLFKKIKYKHTSPLYVLKSISENSNNNFYEAKKITKKILEELKRGISELETATNSKIREIVVTGGQGENPYWNQIKADFLKVNIIQPEITEGELLGDAVLFFVSTGFFPDIDQGVEKLFKISKIYYPKNPDAINEFLQSK